MRSIFYVGAGSFVGGILRYLLSTWIYKVLGNPLFPDGTVAVNSVGCLAIGFLAGLAEVGRSLLQMIVSLFLSAYWEDSQPSRPWRWKHCDWQEAARAWPR